MNLLSRARSLSFGVPLFVLLTSTLTAFAAPPRTIRHDFSLQIVSGSREGERHAGSVTVAKSGLPKGGTGTVEAVTFSFTYAGKRFTQKDLDSTAQVRFERGVPVELIAVGGPGHLRFGFSAGFSREQFGRDEEAFINEGRPYFGYLDPQTYVDGAGVVSFGSRSVARSGPQ